MLNLRFISLQIIVILITLFSPYAERFATAEMREHDMTTGESMRLEELKGFERESYIAQMKEERRDLGIIELDVRTYCPAKFE